MVQFDDANLPVQKRGTGPGRYQVVTAGKRDGEPIGVDGRQRLRYCVAQVTHRVVASRGWVRVGECPDSLTAGSILDVSGRHGFGLVE